VADGKSVVAMLTVDADGDDVALLLWLPDRLFLFLFWWLC